jgi:hypothetical protein
MIGSVSELVEFAARIDIFVDRRNQAAAKDLVATVVELVAHRLMVRQEGPTA